jgi:hypothetical protein
MKYLYSFKIKHKDGITRMKTESNSPYKAFQTIIIETKRRKIIPNSIELVMSYSTSDMEARTTMKQVRESKNYVAGRTDNGK